MYHLILTTKCVCNSTVIIFVRFNNYAAKQPVFGDVLSLWFILECIFHYGMTQIRQIFLLLSPSMLFLNFWVDFWRFGDMVRILRKEYWAPQSKNAITSPKRIRILIAAAKCVVINVFGTSSVYKVQIRLQVLATKYCLTWKLHILTRFIWNTLRSYKKQGYLW